MQDRLVKELTLRNISSKEKANEYLTEYIKKHNEKFSVEPKEKEDMHKKLTKAAINDAMRYKEQRVLSKNLELSYCNRILQIKTDRPTYAMRRAKVTIVESLDGKIEIEYQGKKLDYKELLVKNRQGKILNRKEALTRAFPLGGKGIINF